MAICTAVGAAVGAAVGVGISGGHKVRWWGLVVRRPERRQRSNVVTPVAFPFAPMRHKDVCKGEPDLSATTMALPDERGQAGGRE